MDKKLSCGVLIDLEKSSDTVNHKIILPKLTYYRIRDNANLWFESYLYVTTHNQY